MEERIGRGPESQPFFEVLHPAVEWAQDSTNHVLHVYLPGFESRTLTVHLKESDKLRINGLRREGQRILVVDEFYQLPEDSDVGKITRRFKDGRMTLLIPKQPVPPLPKPLEKPIQQQPPRTQPPEPLEKPAEQQTQPSQTTKPLETPAQQQPPSRPPKPLEKLLQPQQRPPLPPSRLQQEEKLAQQSQQLRLRSPSAQSKPEEKAETPRLRPSKEKERKDKEDTQVSEKATQMDEDVDDNFMRDLKEETKKKQRELSEKVEEVSSKTKRNWRVDAVEWKEKGKEVLLDCGRKMQKRWEKINTNRTVIAVAVIAFSVGFFVCYKLRTTARFKIVIHRDFNKIWVY